jgi:hypothetical protein
MALFLGTCMPVMDETNLLVGYSFVESMDVLKSKYSSLVLIAIHTSSNEVFSVFIVMMI